MLLRVVCIVSGSVGVLFERTFRCRVCANRVIFCGVTL